METPCLIADMEKIKHNISHMQELSRLAHCKLRPHIKTHKSVEIARMQTAQGASGITCAKISEAEIMADGGIDDIFIAYPLWGEGKRERAAALHRCIRRLILGVDSYDCAKQLSLTAQKHGLTFELRLEVDTGAKRTGIKYEEAVDLAKAIVQLPNIHLSGLYTFKGLTLDGKPTLDAEAAAREECALLHDLRQSLEKAGVLNLTLSAGSTPTAAACLQTGLLDEIRPGTYVFHDQMTYRAGACRYDDIAVHIRATVVSVPSCEYAVLDGGSKVFPTDISFNNAPFYFNRFAYVPGRDDLLLNRLSEEHGIITASGGETGLHAGECLDLIPLHVCTAVNLRDFIYVKENGCLRKLRVDARGQSV